MRFIIINHNVKSEQVVMLKVVLFVLDGASMPEGTGDYNLKLFINFPELPTTAMRWINKLNKI